MKVNNNSSRNNIIFYIMFYFNIYFLDYNSFNDITQRETEEEIFREFLKLSFRLFNGEIIREWLYENYINDSPAYKNSKVTKE